MLKRLLRSKRLLIVPPILVGLAVIAVLVSMKKEIKRVEHTEKATPVKATYAVVSPLAPEVVGFGTAAANRRWTAVAEVGGQIAKSYLQLKPGISVTKGQPLLQIDDSDYQLRFQQRQAELRQAQAQLRQLELARASDEKSLQIQQAMLVVRDRDVKRLAELRLNQSASWSEADVVQLSQLQQQQTVQNLLNSLSTYEAQIESAEASIALSAARVQEAKRDLERTTIVANFDGLLANVALEEGQYVAPKEALLDIIDTTSVEVETQISLAQLRRLVGGPKTAVPDGVAPNIEFAQQGVLQPAMQSLPAVEVEVVTRSGASEMRYSGEVVRVTPSLDERSRTLGLVVRVSNATAAGRREISHASELRPGSFCEVRLRSNQPTSAISVPNAALVDSMVFCITDQNRVQRRQVQIGFEVQGRTTITSGLSDGEIVILDPASSLVDRQLVAPTFSDAAVFSPSSPSSLLKNASSDQAVRNRASVGAAQQEVAR